MASESAQSLRQALLELGFDVVRFARIDGEAPGAAALTERLSAGMLADMDWLARNADKRRDPQLVLPGARTMIALGVNYFQRPEARGQKPEAGGRKSEVGEKDAGLPVWARYSMYEDYHDTMKPALVAAGRILEEKLGLGGGDYRYYVDTGPVLERGWATKAGLGFTGKNAMLISREFGNWLFLATILVRADIEPDAPLGSAEGEPKASNTYCGRCTRCLDACPTQALPAPGVLDARRCISYLTIENKGSIPVEFRAAIGKRIYGCDICAEVCPWNRFAQDSRDLLLSPRPEIAELGLRDILRLTPERFAAVFKGTPIKRVKLAGLLRNACVVAGNSGDASLLEDLKPLISHESALVREHAEWAIDKLRG